MSFKPDANPALETKTIQARIEKLSPEQKQVIEIAFGSQPEGEVKNLALSVFLDLLEEGQVSETNEVMSEFISANHAKFEKESSLPEASRTIHKFTLPTNNTILYLDRNHLSNGDVCEEQGWKVCQNKLTGRVDYVSPQGENGSWQGSYAKYRSFFCVDCYFK
jgi:hypothetical protein